MGNYKARRPGFLQGWQIQVADYLFRGANDEEIAKAVLKVPDDDPKAMRNAKYRLSKLRKDEKFIEYYRTLITEWSVHNVGKALNKLADQIDSDKPWIANKAANDVLLHSKQLVNNADDNSVVVKMEGTIELGSPDADS